MTGTCITVDESYKNLSVYDSESIKNKLSSRQLQMWLTDLPMRSLYYTEFTKVKMKSCDIS